MSDYKDIISRIVTLRTWIEKELNWQDGEAIAEAQAKLALLLAMLGDHRASLHQQASQEHLMAYKKARAQDMTVSDSEIEAKEVSLKIRAEYENVEYVFKSTSILVDSLRTLCSTIRQEKSNVS